VDIKEPDQRRRRRGFRRTSGTNLYDLHEQDLVREIVFGSRRLYEFLGFAVTDVHGLRSEDGWEYFFFGNIPRQALGLPRLGQPGDIDLLVVPYRGRELHLGKAAAIEVKRLALKGPRWDKNTDRYGIKQAHGLLAAGFPYVGILHLVVHASGPPENHKETLRARVVGTNDEIAFEGNQVTDMTGWIAAERQMKRLFSRDIDPAIGINCVSLADVSNGDEQGVMVGTPQGRNAQRNPNTTRECLEGIHAFVLESMSHVVTREIDLVADSGRW
jgi:hypothetical protein